MKKQIFYVMEEVLEKYGHNLPSTEDENKEEDPIVAPEVIEPGIEILFIFYQKSKRK